MRVIPSLKEIRKERKRAGLSQAQLASMVRISQPHLAKIENDNVDPSYGLVARIFDALDRTIKDECWQYMSRDVMAARKGDKVAAVAPLMKERGYSQVPVLERGEPIGMLTEDRIIELKRPYQDLLVEEAMVDPVIVPKETSYNAVEVLVGELGSVLVKEKERIIGIITVTDLIGHQPKKENLPQSGR